MTNKIFAAIAVTWATALLIALLVAIGPPVSLWPAAEVQLPLIERMAHECERQFSGKLAVEACTGRLWRRYIAEEVQDRLNSAYQRAR